PTSSATDPSNRSLTSHGPAASVRTTSTAAKTAVPIAARRTSGAPPTPRAARLASARDTSCSIGRHAPLPTRTPRVHSTERAPNRVGGGAGAGPREDAGGRPPAPPPPAPDGAGPPGEDGRRPRERPARARGRRHASESTGARPCFRGNRVGSRSGSAVSFRP